MSTRSMQMSPRVSGASPEHKRAHVDPGASITLSYLVKQVELAVRSQIDELASSRGITVVQYTAMTVLERHPGIISARLARNSFVKAQSMAQVVDALESRGLIQREADPTSRRQFLISLTPQGQALLDDMRDGVAAIESRMTASLSAAQVGDLRDMLRACRVALSGEQAH